MCFLSIHSWILAKISYITPRDTMHSREKELYNFKRQNSLCVYLFMHSREKELYNFKRQNVLSVYSWIIARKSYITSWDYLFMYSRKKELYNFMRQNSLCVYLFMYSRKKELYNFMRLSIHAFTQEKVISIHEIE
jgi:hypothetical protein